ncbi:hypothetical protein LTR09_006059 [Extremus antarcticus]|uniref:Uncharacterized protein n=1 Tax=Extremus antarcticus TaxID=702011 RepID=A0AAJ0DLZ3_9PEZI|nr:hypothetical protein LTR09_006059 [Extremus antarcticus]
MLINGSFENSHRGYTSGRFSSISRLSMNRRCTSSKLNRNGKTNGNSKLNGSNKLNTSRLCTTSKLSINRRYTISKLDGTSKLSGNSKLRGSNSKLSTSRSSKLSMNRRCTTSKFVGTSTRNGNSRLSIRNNRLSIRNKLSIPSKPNMVPGLTGDNELSLSNSRNTTSTLKLNDRSRPTFSNNHPPLLYKPDPSVVNRASRSTRTYGKGRHALGRMARVNKGRVLLARITL